MLKPMLPQNRQGFTLVEVLIASLLVSAVMAMAMQGFTSAKRAADLNRAKVIAHDEAAQGVSQLSALLRRASIVFFTGLPQSNLSAAAADAQLNAINMMGPPTAVPMYVPNSPNVGPVPAVFQALLPANHNIVYTLGSPALAYNAMTATTNRNQYRFSEFMGGQTLKTSDGTNRSFPSPLLYFAEAIFAPAPAGTTNMMANIPLAWNFYVVYLAPLDLSEGKVPGSPAEPLCPATGGSQAATRDKLSNGNTRSTVPFEMRLFSITGVSATTGGIPAAGAPPLIYGHRTDPVPPYISVLPVPYDIPAGQINYDPVAVACSTAGTAPYLFPGPHPYGGAAPNQTRVNGTTAHTNYGFLGNDPPHNSVFAGVGAANCSDRIIARYIDPDAVDGTYVRFYNTDAHSEQIRLVPTIRNLSGDVAMRNPLAWNPNITYPSRMAVGVATRYRSGRDIAFQFASESQEVTLEAAAKYHADSIQRTMRL
jgi:prepilin-type N-terminal cleavage/methylation domain-containing protein